MEEKEEKGETEPKKGKKIFLGERRRKKIEGLKDRNMGRHCEDGIERGEIRIKRKGRREGERR